MKAHCYISTLLILFSTPVAHSQIDILHSFSAGSDGAYPGASSLTISSLQYGSTGAGGTGPITIYGITGGGGSSGQGTIYSMKPDGSNYSVLHAFSTLTTPAGPKGGVSLIATPFFSTTIVRAYGVAGGTFGSVYVTPTLFGGGVQNTLHTFAGATSDGSEPTGLLAKSESALFGMTTAGGPNNSLLGGPLLGLGTIYKVNTDGSGYAVLHYFGASGDGSMPNGGLILSGSTLYGVTPHGGPNVSQTGIPISISSAGTIFKINTDGTSYSLLKSFSSDGTDGLKPTGSLVLSGQTLYGITEDGGSGGGGTVFKINSDGSGFTTLHAFAGGPQDGDYPVGGLVIQGEVLYGVTVSGGRYGLGTVFRLNADGSDFSLLHSFSGINGDGAQPQGALTLLNGKLFGTTNIGGTFGYGSVFSYTLPNKPFEATVSQTIDSGIKIEWNAQRGCWYRVQYSGSLLPEDWHDLTKEMLHDSLEARMNHTDYPPPGTMRRFYRVIRRQ